MKKTVHKSVMLQESLENLNLSNGKNIIDGTFGGGGHSTEILKVISLNGKLLAIDANSDTLEQEVTKDLQQNKNFKLVIDNFRNLKKIFEDNKDFINSCDGILLDLGISSDELEQSGRGFSFQNDEPLDMRFDVNQELTAAEVLNTYSLEDLYNVIKNYGEYRRPRKLAEEIIAHRKAQEFKSTFDLVNLILEVTPRHFKDRLHPATKVFQALRIEVNSELESIEKVLPQAVEILASGGRLVVIAFHALEDRIVKHYFRNLVKQENSPIKILTKRPLVPSDEEIKENPRARSAKMRIIEKI